MPVQLNGVSGWAGRTGPNGEVTPEKSKKTNREERVENLKSEILKLKEGDAKGALIELRRHIDGAPRNGFLRLDGGGRSGDVSFSTHSWKGWGKSAKGEVTGEALRALFKQAGYDTYHLDKYLGTRGQDGYRGNQRVELGQLRAIMTNTGIEVPEENAGKAPDTSWKTWLPVDLKYSADPETLAKIKSAWEGDEEVKGDGVQVKVEEEATRFKKVAGARNKIDGTFSTADEQFPNFAKLDLVFANDMTRGNGTSFCQLEGKPDNLVNIPKKGIVDKEQADLFQRKQANDYFGFFRNEFPDNPEKAEKWATLASCFLHQGTSMAALIPQRQKGIISSDVGAGGTENFTLKMDPDGNSATLTLETNGVPVNISSVSGMVLLKKPDEAASFGIDREASSRSEKLVLRITLDDSQPVGADPNKLLGDLEVISFDYEHHLAMLPDLGGAPVGLVEADMENKVQRDNIDILAWKKDVPVDYELNYNSSQKDLLANSLSENIHEPIKKEAEAGYREGLSKQFTKDIERANYSLISSGKDPGVSFGISHQNIDPMPAYYEFFQKEFPDDPDKASRWAKLASCFLNQRVGGANNDIFRKNAGFSAGQPMDYKGFQYSFTMNPGGESATITYTCSGVPRMIAPGDRDAAGWEMIAFADDQAEDCGVDASNSTRNEDMKFTIFLNAGTNAADPAEQLLGGINVDSYTYKHHIATLP